MLSTDSNILKEGSAVRVRMAEYGQLFDNLYIILLSSGPTQKQKISENVHIYSINSDNKIKASVKAVNSSKYFKDIDVVSSQNPFELGVIGYVISKKLKAKFHVQIHTDFLNENFSRFSLRNAFSVGISKIVLPRAKGIRVVSERIKRSLFKVNINCEPVVLPILVDREKLITNVKIDLRKKYPEFETLVLTVSRLEKEKDIETLLKGFNQVINFYPKTALVIIGSGYELDNLKRLVKDLGIEDKVKFEGYQEDIYSYMKTADIYAQSSMYEGYGMTLVEAALLRLPIVSTRVGIVGDVLKAGQGALTCEVSDSECMGKNIVKLIEDKELRNSIYMEALKEINEHVISKEEYMERYKNSLHI